MGDNPLRIMQNPLVPASVSQAFLCCHPRSNLRGQIAEIPVADGFVPSCERDGVASSPWLQPASRRLFFVVILSDSEGPHARLVVPSPFQNEVRDEGDLMHLSLACHSTIHSSSQVPFT
jgi:hypothetical protein